MKWEQRLEDIESGKHRDGDHTVLAKDDFQWLLHRMKRLTKGLIYYEYKYPEDSEIAHIALSGIDKGIQADENTKEKE